MPKRNDKARREQRKVRALVNLGQPQGAQAVAIREASRGYGGKWDAIRASVLTADTSCPVAAGLSVTPDPAGETK